MIIELKLALMRILPLVGVCLGTLLWGFGSQAQVDDNQVANEKWARSQVGTWYRPAPNNINSHAPEHELKFVEVSDAFEKQAEILLRSKAALPISVAQAKQMSGGKYHGRKNKPFLVRAVYLNKATGEFSVVLQGKNLFVFHSCFSDAILTVKRQVLIVDLAQEPRNVYRDCTVAA